MSDQKAYTKTTEVKTETSQNSGGALNREYKEETTVKTERTVEKERDPVIIVEEE